MHDLLIRGAELIDGLGHEPTRSDVAVKNGRVTEIAPAGSMGVSAAVISYSANWIRPAVSRTIEPQSAVGG